MLTDDQFQALTKLMRGEPDSAANRAARMVLVEGLSQADAGRATDVQRSTVSQAVKRYSDAHDLIVDAYGKRAK